MFVAKLAEAAFANVHDVVQADEVCALVIEAEPTAALSVFAEAFEVLFAVVVEHVVFTGNVEHFLGFAAFEDLLKRVEFFRLGKMREVAGVEEEVGRRR